MKLLNWQRKAPDAIISSDDPFIDFLKTTTPILQKNMQLKNEIDETEEMLEEELGRALYEVYGTEIPPDATFHIANYRLCNEGL
jgi:hypothetical protein